ncbi:MAG: sigma-70 family RNA polymerase sigma factor [Bryobacterales bacterium]|nr:sigma-70 family RNA polymerase sigma factor [Bryobacterales bacterium]
MTGEITNLLEKWRGGDLQAAQDLAPLVYPELRRLAVAHLRREYNGGTFQPTELVNEAFLRLLGQRHPLWQSRAHFFSVSSKLMRQVLVDHARQLQAAKRGSGLFRQPLDRAKLVQRSQVEEFLRLDEALTALEQFDQRMVWVVEHHFFGGWSADEIAEMTDLSAATIRRELRLASAWLRNHLKQ